MSLQKIKYHLFTPRWHFSRIQFNLAAAFLIFAGIVAGSYLTLTEFIFPKVFALNDTTKTWTFNTANAGDYTYDSSLIIVDDSGARPVTGVNKITNPAFVSDNSSWSVGAVAPSGWVEVPGNAAYSTSNFLVMKYEAKCAATSDPATGLTSPENSSYNTYNDGATPCTSANNREVVSVASGYPIANINNPNAVTRCQNVSINGNATHLITNDEWMTIARNSEAQASNWSLGAVGSGYLFAGHNDNNPAKARQASTTDTGNYRCAYTDGDPGTENPSTCPTNTANGTSGNVGNQVRTLSFSNGAVIWDLAGNVWELVQRDSSNTLTSQQDLPDGSGTGWAWYEHTALTSYGNMNYDMIRPLGSSYDANYGMGRVYTNSNSTDTTADRVFLRGGNWYSASLTGAFVLYLSWTTSNTYTYVGFRCSSDSVAISQSFSSSAGRSATGGNLISIGDVTDGKIYQSVNVGNTNTYDLSAYVYDNTSGSEGGTVSSGVAELYYNGAAISTTYTNIGSGWWKLTGSLTGANESRDYGILVKRSKNIKVDDFTLAKQGVYSVYNTSAYSNSQVTTWDSFTPSVTASGNASVIYQLCTDDGSTCESGNSWQYWDGSAWQTASNTATHTNTAVELTQTAMQALQVVSQKISVKAILGFGGVDTPAVSSMQVGLTTDTTAPTTNASGLSMTRAVSGTAMSSNDWTNNSSPYFSWTAGADNAGGVGLKGYCLYLGADADGDPATSKGLLGTSPVSTAGSTCQFIASGTSIDFATASYTGDTWLTSSSSPYYLNIKAIDEAENIFSGSSVQFQFRFDNTAPTNMSYISCASGSFSNVADMNFSWPTSGSALASDSHAGLFGYQYQINSTDGTWLGTTTESILGVGNYVPSSETSRTLAQDQDDSSIVSGNNIVYLRAVDAAGNISTDAVRTCNLSYGGAAPSFADLSSITITPSTSTANSFALSWPEASATSGQNVAGYYYMVNTAPPSTYATLTGNASTYVSNSTSTSVSATALPGVNKGSNTVYVVAVDDADTPNYSPSNYISGTFTLNSTDPDNVGNLVASDSSIKAQSQWNVTLTWTAPSYQGAGNLTYLIYRSSDGSIFAQVGSTSGLSYVDNTSSSAQYYYKIYTKDGAEAQSSGTNAVNITPTGKWTTAPSLDSGPAASLITTKKATITWSTSRTSDSKIQYGTTSGSYGSVEPSNSSQVVSHSIKLTGLVPGTTYYYKAKWTDEDGNTGTSSEKTFVTAAAPTVYDVSAKSIGLTTSTIEYTVKGASKVKIYYGKTTDFGGVKEVSTSTSETTYTTELASLDDGAKYYYKINTYDSENDEYEGTVLDFTTLPRPKVSKVRIQQVAGAAQPTVLVSWQSNTKISSIVTYYPANNSSKARDEVNVELTEGAHKMIIRGLKPHTDYMLVVKGRDKIGNEAVSDSQKFTTATDTRPPIIADLRVEGTAIPQTAGTAQESVGQIVVAWNTDEPATSQVEFGEGTGANYSQKTQEDVNLTYNHVVVISNLATSKVYHLRAISKDSVENEGHSVDTVTITPKATANALNLVISGLQQAFGFLGGLKR